MDIKKSLRLPHTKVCGLFGTFGCSRCHHILKDVVFLRHLDIKRLVYFIFGVALFILFFSLLNFFLGQKVLQTEVFYASVNVSGRGGFDLNKSALTFGEIARGGSSTRNLIIENNFPHRVVAKISCQGEICEILNFEKKISLNKEGKKKISFTVVANSNSEQGFYDGQITVQLRRKTTLL